MAFYPRKGCATCAQIEIESPDNPTKSTMYKLIDENLLGKRKLTDIQRAYPDILYQSIRNHSFKHQGITETRLAKSKVRKTEIDVAKHRRYKERHHTENRGDLVEWLMGQIDEGKVKPTASAIVALLKQQTDIEEKQKDRVHDMQKLFSSYIANPLPEVATRHITYEEGEVVEPDSPSSSQ